MDRRPDPFKQRARELAVAAGYADPDVKVPQGEGLKDWPVWCSFRDAAKQEQFGPRIAPVKEGAPFKMLIEADNELEQGNVDAVRREFEILMRTPVIKAGAVMPDACPAGKAGSGEITVGGVVASEGIHPGMHSADICCSMAISILDSVSPTQVMDAGMKLSHFGAGGRPYSHDMQCPDALLEEFAMNPFLSMTIELAKKHFGTQGDGNHFFYVGHLKSTNQVALVTHHGSRAPGAALYKAGMATAEAYRKRISPETADVNAWIPADTIDGENYWNALQIIRKWTKKNHFTIHDAVAKFLGVKVKGRFWNEHNFVFRKTDGLFYHGKGATPAFPNFGPDATDLTIIPLNMAEPILIVQGKNNPDALGFSPHGAGRNMSRTAHLRLLGDRTKEEVLKTETAGLDIRFYSGKADLSELPSAYKSAAAVRRQIETFGLAEVVDEVIPFGTIMAGDDGWRDKRAAKKAARQRALNDRNG